MPLLCLLLLLQLLSTAQGLASLVEAQSKSKPFLVYYDSTNYMHRDIAFHYEIPERITACVRALHSFRQRRPELAIDLIDVCPPELLTLSSSSTEIEKRYQPFTDEELAHARSVMKQTHHPYLITSLEDLCRKSKERRIQEGKPALGHIGYIDSGDTFVTTETFDVCLRAAATWIRAVDDCLTNELDSPSENGTIGNRMAMALTRPPGHHATYNSQNGFCLYNFAAAAAIHAVQKHGNNAKVSILDWDVHYGQGVADIAKREEHKDNIRYVSIHQTPAFPYEGERHETSDNVMTIPMPPDTSWTCGYQPLLETALNFCAKAHEWEPDLVIICAGYDALSNDVLASTSLDAADYGSISRRLCQHLAETCKTSPRIMLGLEGGYHLGNSGTSGNLPDAVIETIQALIEQPYL